MSARIGARPSTGRTLALLLVLATTLGLGVGCGAFKRWMYAGGDRDSWQQPDRVIETLALRPDMRVADLGSGGGYFTFRIADALGEYGRVFAVDVDDEMLSFIESEAIERGDGDRVLPIRADFDDPKIPEAGVDLLFTSNTYHHLRDREAYFRNAARYLRPGARVAIIEFDGEKGGFFARWFGHNTPPDDIRREMAAAGYRQVASHDWLERQSFLIFSRVE